MYLFNLRCHARCIRTIITYIRPHKNFDTFLRQEFSSEADGRVIILVQFSCVNKCVLVVIKMNVIIKETQLIVRINTYHRNKFLNNLYNNIIIITYNNNDLYLSLLLVISNNNNTECNIIIINLIIIH